MIKIAIIIGSTRPGRRGPAVAEWVYELAKKRTDAEFEIVDIEAFHLPVFDEELHPVMHQYAHEHTKKWAGKIGEFDGFIFVTPEYNHGTSAALKNAIDYLSLEWNNKAAGFVGYGAGGATRAVENLRTVLSYLQIAHVSAQVGISIFSDFKDSRLVPDARHETLLNKMLDQLVPWTRAMQTERQ